MNTSKEREREREGEKERERKRECWWLCTMIKCLYLVSLETWHPHREEVHRQTVNEIMQHPMNGTSVIASKENHEVMCVSVCIIMSVYVCVCLS